MPRPAASNATTERRRRTRQGTSGERWGTWYDDDDLRLGLGLGRRRSTEKRAQDARASDGAPIGASVTAIVAGCGAADTLGLPLGQVRVLHGSTPFLDEGYGAFASRSTVLGGSAVRRCSAGRRCSRRRMPCSPRSAPPPVRGWAVPMIRRTRSASSAALSGRTSFCCPRRSPAAGVGACFRCSSSGVLRPLPSASQRASARLARAFP